MPVDPKYIVLLGGKAYPTFPGVLDEAFRQGLYAVHTDLVQIPAEENGMVAIVTARALFKRDGELFEFQGLGDAAPNNVGPRIATALIRMAETRSIGRALRMGTNIGETMYEELPPERAAAPAVGDEELLAKKRQRYDDLRAEAVSYGLKDPGKLPPKATTAQVEARGKAIWPAILAERQKRAGSAAPPAPVEPAVAAPAPEPAPAPEAAPKPAPTREQLWAGWERITAVADSYGLTYTPLEPKATADIIRARGKALSQTVQAVEQDYALLDGLLQRAAEIDFQVAELDREKTDANALHRFVEQLAIAIGKAEAAEDEEAGMGTAPAAEEAAPAEFDPFA